MAKHSSHDKSKSKWEKFAKDQQDELLEEETEQPAQAERELGHDTDLGIEFPDREKLERQLTEMEQLVSDYKDKNLRLAAQMQNLQERSERDISKAHKFGAEKLVTDLLPVLDSLVQGLDSASAEANQADGILQGMKLTLELLIKTLQKHGVEIINPTVGEGFNPEIHEAMTMQETPDAEPNTVLQVLQQGYSLNGRVLRAARVIVAR